MPSSRGEEGGGFSLRAKSASRDRDAKERVEGGREVACGKRGRRMPQDRPELDIVVIHDAKNRNKQPEDIHARQPVSREQRCCNQDGADLFHNPRHR